MTMKNLIRLIISGILLCPLIGGMTSCSEEADCSATARAMMQCNLYKMNPETQLVTKDTLDVLTVTAMGTDSVIINGQTNVSDISLPLQFATDSTALILQYGQDGERKDTVIIRHTNTPYFLSMDCGYQMKQHITAVSWTSHLLDSIYIENPEAGIYEKENLKLFY